jgi:dihydroorotate dehydrogenase
MLADLGAAALRLLDPETAHTLALRALAMGMGPAHSAPSPPRLKTSIAGLALANPLGLAAGFDKNAQALNGLSRMGFGFIEAGTVTPKAQEGNARPRLFRLAEDGAVINRMGFNNGGLHVFLDNIRLHRSGAIIGANIGANKDSKDRVEDYAVGYARVHPWADYVTVNVSSPNTPGLRGLQDKGALETLLARLGGVRSGFAGARKPLFLKIAPDLDGTAIDDIATLALAHGLDGLIISNTTIARPESLASRYKGETGGLSGDPLFGLSTKILLLFAQRLMGQMCLIGVGGVRDAATALAKVKAGASAVQLYSALALQGPALIPALLQELDARLAAEGFATLDEAIGADAR